MKHPTRWLAYVAAGLMCAAFAATACYVWSPLFNASKIRIGDSAARVHELLGEPAGVFETTDQLRTSGLRSMSYVFTDREGRGGFQVEDLPPVVVRAEWFEYASSGDLVYYDENGVTAVFWGGT